MDLTGFKFEFTSHRDQNIILCKFKYDHTVLSQFRKAFPSAKWSKTLKSWYLSDTNLYRKRLGLDLLPIGFYYESKINPIHLSAFKNYRDQLILKAYSPSTIETYLSEFAHFLIHLNDFPLNKVNPITINSYSLFCIQKLKHSENQIHSKINAIKTYFRIVEKKEIELLEVVRPKKISQLPKVLSKKEIKAIFNVIENPKHALIVKLVYGMGLRVSEVVNLKINDIDSNRMQVRIENAKGKNDRMVNLPTSILDELRNYYKQYNPSIYLFEGQFGGQYTTRSVQAVFKRAMTKAKVNKKIGIHGLRHSFATHLLERGTDMVFIQKLLGHKNVKTTEIYAKVSTKTLSRVESPLDDL